jgi:Ca2+/H+ antiporter
VLFINFGSNDQLLRLLVGLLMAFFGLTLQQQTQPFRKQSDDVLSCVIQLMLVLFFILGIVLKLCDTDESCSSVVGIDSAYTASVLMICVALIGVLVPIGMVVHQLFFGRRVPILRDAHTMEPPELLLGEDERYHLFLCPSHPNTSQAARSFAATRIPKRTIPCGRRSHIWSTGQDQCAVIKRQLQLLLPGIIVFLDVDDLRAPRAQNP